MLNALWFRPDGGAARYSEYGQAVAPMIEDVGAEIIVPPLSVDAVLQGDFDPDLFFVVRYPSADAFDQMWRSDAYAEVSPLRRDALSRGVLVRCAIDPVDAGPVELRPGIAILNILWFEPGGRERYDEYLTAARPLVEAVGGRYIAPRFVPQQAIEDAFDPDLIFIGNYPSRAALEALVTNAEYIEVSKSRGEAVRRSCTTSLQVP